MIRYQRLYVDSAYLESPVDGNAGYDLPAYGDYIIPPAITSSSTFLDVYPSGEVRRINQELYKPHFVAINTGIAIEIPEGYCGLVLGRSGLAFNKQVFVTHVGVIDSNYRGEIRVNITNSSSEYFKISSGDRIAQLVIVPIATWRVEEASQLSSTKRAEGGFGSTGLKGLVSDLMRSA